MTLSNRKDKLSASALIVLALVLFFYLIPQYVSQAETPALSPRFFPYFGSLLVGIGGAILLLCSFRSMTDKNDIFAVGEEASLSSFRPLIVILVMSIFVMVFESFGYLSAAPPLVVALMLVFGARSVLLLCTVPVAVTATLYLMFSAGFGVNLP